MGGPPAFGAMVQSRSLTETRELAAVADDAGLDWLGFPNSPVVYQDTFLHQMAALEVTSRLSVGPLVTHVTIRHPLTVANALATLQEVGPGRVRAAMGTGNSGATGVGLRPATLAELVEGIACMRSWWAGEAGTFRDTRVPASGILRTPSPILVAADGRRGAGVAATFGDGLVYGGGLDVEQVSSRRAASSATGGAWQMWVAPTFSLAETYDDVVEDVGAQVVAMANRALRGTTESTGLPLDLAADLRELHERYDYGTHADSRRAGNVLAARPRLMRYLIDRFVVWGDRERWSRTLAGLEDLADGVIFIFGHSNAALAMSALSGRLTELRSLADMSS